MRLEKHYILPAKLNAVRNMLVDLVHYGRLHPLIQCVKKMDSGSDEYKEYRISERPYSSIPINIQYSARVRSSQNFVTYQILGIPFFSVNMNYRLNPITEEETNIEFELLIEGSLIGGRILANKMRSAQNQLMAHIVQNGLTQKKNI